jgi:hypothetical protein
VNQSGTIVTDYAAYWSASHLLLAGQNPYDAEKVFTLEKSVSSVSVPLVMRNPPWALPFVLPLGLFGYKLSRLWWALPQILILLASASWTWRQYSRSSRFRGLALLVAVTFFPAIWVLYMGQITPFILLGVVGFLYCEFNERSNSWLQAICLVLIALKPQLLYLFWFVLGLSAAWALRDLDSPTRELRRWSLFLKFALLLAAFSAVALIFDSRVFAEYWDYLRKTPILLEPIPTIGNLLRMRTHMPWTQFAPMLVGCGWAFSHWAKRRQGWNWLEGMPLLVLASLLTTTYCWFYDQIVLLPALLYAMGQNFPSRNKIQAMIVVLIYFEVNAGIFALFLHAQKLTNFNLLWTTPVWCGLFAVMCWLGQRNKIASATPQLEPADSPEPEEAPSYASNLAA